MAAQGDDQYLIHARKEILVLLRDLTDARAMFTAHFDQESMLTSILDVHDSNHTMTLDYGANEFMNRKLLRSKKIIFVTSHQHIKVQFSANTVTKVRYDRNDAFRISIPPSVLRLQRRQFYRIDTPLINPPACNISVVSTQEKSKDESPELPDEKRVNVSIVNISVGGVALHDIPSSEPVKRGTVLEKCHIKLPDIKKIDMDMECVHTRTTKSRKGKESIRYGFKFLSLTGGIQSSLQHYIINLDRERRKQGTE